jgi:hypothetical protein
VGAWLGSGVDRSHNPEPGPGWGKEDARAAHQWPCCRPLSCSAWQSCASSRAALAEALAGCTSSTGGILASLLALLSFSCGSQGPPTAASRGTATRSKMKHEQPVQNVSLTSPYLAPLSRCTHSSQPDFCHLLFSIALIPELLIFICADLVSLCLQGV